MHAALSKYGIEPIYDKNVVGKMATDVLKLIDGYNEYYTWNGETLSTGIYRLGYLGQSDGGKVVAYIYCEIT